MQIQMPSYPSVMRTNENNVREAIDIIPEFDPTSSSLPSPQYIRRVELLKCTYQWSDKTTIFGVLTNLVMAFLRDFRSEFDIADIHLEAAAMRWESNDSFENYFYKMLSIFAEVNSRKPVRLSI